MVYSCEGNSEEGRAALMRSTTATVLCSCRSPFPASVRAPGRTCNPELNCQVSPCFPLLASRKKIAKCPDVCLQPSLSDLEHHRGCAIQEDPHGRHASAHSLILARSNLPKHELLSMCLFATASNERATSAVVSTFQSISECSSLCRVSGLTLRQKPVPCHDLSPSTTK